MNILIPASKQSIGRAGSLSSERLWEKCYLLICKLKEGIGLSRDYENPDEFLIPIERHLPSCPITEVALKSCYTKCMVEQSDSLIQRESKTSTLITTDEQRKAPVFSDPFSRRTPT